MKIFERVIENEEIKNDLLSTFDQGAWFDCDFVEDISYLKVKEEFIKKEIK